MKKSMRESEKYLYDFEDGSAGDWILRCGATLTQNPEEVIAGSYSVKVDTTSKKAPGWHEFLVSNPDKLRLKPGKTYKVSFDYRILSLEWYKFPLRKPKNVYKTPPFPPQEPDRKPSFFYFMARTVDASVPWHIRYRGWTEWGAEDAEKYKIELNYPEEDIEKEGKKHHKEVIFALAERDDYCLVFGIWNAGSLVIDNIKIETVPACISPVRLSSPQDSARLTDIALFFAWFNDRTCMPCVIEYELQVARDRNFNKDVKTFKIIPYAADLSVYFPQKSLSEGKWYWRVRGINGERKGGFSETRSFVINKSLTKKSPELRPSSENPLFIFRPHLSDIVKCWKSIPQDIKPYSTLVVWSEKQSPCTKYLLCYAELAKENNIPLILQVATACDILPLAEPLYTTIPLSDIEYMFQKFPSVKGVFICERQGSIESAPTGDYKYFSPRGLRYIKNLIELAAKHGKIVVWADGHEFFSVWINAFLNKEFYETVRQNKEYLVPVWKMNQLYSTPVGSSLLGLWLSDTVENWGVEPESWFWFEAGFSKLGEVSLTWCGKREDCPPTFLGQQVLLGMAGGATIFSTEPVSDVWESPGKFSPNGKVYLSLFREILKRDLIPKKKEVLSKVKISCMADGFMHKRECPMLIKSAYGIRDLARDMIPNISKYYYIPILPKHTPSGTLASFSNVVPASLSYDTDLDVLPYLKQYTQEDGKGTAWITRVGDRIFIMNTWENQDRQEDYNVSINHSLIKRIKGKVGPHQYLVVKETAQGIYIHVNNRRERKSTIIISSLKRPILTVESTRALEKEVWNKDRKELRIVLNHFLGAVNLELRGGEDE
ncbi:DUF4962 domain-containing protein [Candidatus Calescamantes bacterium]|nr:DUF4962 domain-containing protein [Candidatus Calescamantes bacterium]